MTEQLIEEDKLVKLYDIERQPPPPETGALDIIKEKVFNCVIKDKNAISYADYLTSSPNIIGNNEEGWYERFGNHDKNGFKQENVDGSGKQQIEVSLRIKTTYITYNSPKRNTTEQNVDYQFFPFKVEMLFKEDWNKSESTEKWQEFGIEKNFDYGIFLKNQYRATKGTTVPYKFRIKYKTPTQIETANRALKPFYLAPISYYLSTSDKTVLYVKQFERPKSFLTLLVSDKNKYDLYNYEYYIDILYKNRYDKDFGRWVDAGTFKKSIKLTSS